VPEVTRLLGAAAAAVVACAAFLGGQAIAGGKDKASDAKPVRVTQAAKGTAPEVLRSAQNAVVLPVIAVRQLPLLAAPHRKKVTEAPVQPQTPAIQTPRQQNVTPNPPVRQPQRQSTTPNNNSGGGGGGGGYFDDSG
jgi:hypothetical protein